jgi:glycosyltransferase involved in cell wall biosynthesis
MNSALISIIMPAYNCEKYVAKAIDSILNQTYTNFELLIADDCSKDSTRQIIDSYKDPRIKTFHNALNLGYLKASNKLFKLCKGEYISFQDADDYSDLNRLKKLMDYFFSHPEVDCLGSNVIKISPEGEKITTTNFPLSNEQLTHEFANYKVVFTGSALILKKKVTSKLGFYNEYFDRIGSEDLYLYSFILQNFRVENLPEPLYFYRANPGSVTANHKNAKASVGHQLILWLYKNRLNNKPDYIQSGNWKVADQCAYFFLATNQINKGRFKSLIKFLSAYLKNPVLGFTFFRIYASHFRHSFK